MKALFIGGTGTISLPIAKLLSKNEEVELYVLNRGNNNGKLPSNVNILKADINDVEAVKNVIGDMSFDVVVDFIAFEVEHVKRDVELFKGKIGQYIFISSASIYQKPQINYLVNESSPTNNELWDYSKNKILCEEYLMNEYRENSFPVTIVRPAHTYGDESVPVSLHGALGSYQVIKRIKENKKVIIPGDGNTYWTLTHNSDFALGFVGLMGNIHAIGEAVNVVSGEALTWNNIYQIIANELNVKLNPVYIASDLIAKGDPGTYGPLLGDKSVNLVFDNSKLKNLVPTFAPKVRIDQGLSKTIKYVFEHEELHIVDEAYDNWYDDLIKYYEKIEKDVPKLADY